MNRPPHRYTRTYTLFPNPTLFRSLVEARQVARRILAHYLFTHRDQRLEFGLGLRFGALDGHLAQDLVEHRLQLRFGARLRQVGDELALEHRIDGGDRLDLELRADELVDRKSTRLNSSH